jgi:hypothetical protein
MEDKSRKAWRILVIVGLVLCLGAVLLLVHRSHSRNALRLYLAELRARGEKLTVTELNAGSTPPATSNTTKALFQAVAKLRGGVVGPGNLIPRDFVRPGEALVRWREAVPAPDAPRTAPSATTLTWSQIRDQFQSNDVALAEIREAMRNPERGSGILPVIGVPSGYNFVGLRTAAQWLSAATLVDLHEGRTEQALENLEALGGMARLNSRDYLLVAQMIRVAVSGLGLAATWEFLQRPALSDAQLDRVATIWKDVNFLEGLETALVGERAFGNQYWSRIQTSSAAQARLLLTSGSGTPWTLETTFEDFVALPAYRLTSMEDDQLFYLHCMQDHLEAVRAVRREQAWLKARPAFATNMAAINRIAATPERLKYWITLRVLPNLLKASDTVVRTETERRMTLTVVALQRYRLRFGKFPENLSALVPDFLACLPIDCFNGKPLGYFLEEDGAFRLYSVGEDGRDDNGDPSVLPRANVSFWSGKDAVWPSAASIGH